MNTFFNIVMLAIMTTASVLIPEQFAHAEECPISILKVISHCEYRPAPNARLVRHEQPCVSGRDMLVHKVALWSDCPATGNVYVITFDEGDPSEPLTWFKQPKYVELRGSRSKNVKIKLDGIGEAVYEVQSVLYALEARLVEDEYSVYIEYTDWE